MNARTPLWNSDALVLTVQHRFAIEHEPSANQPVV
jgi:hypothetical protein